MLAINKDDGVKDWTLVGLDIGELRQFRSIKQVQHKNGIYMKHVQLSLGMILNLSLLFKGIAIVLGSFILSVGINFFLVLFENIIFILISKNIPSILYLEIILH